MSVPIKSPELEVLHRQWLTYPVTQQLGRVLDKHSERIIESICAEASNTDEDSDKKLKVFAVQLQKTRTLKRVIYDTDTFISQIA